MSTNFLQARDISLVYREQEPLPPKYSALVDEHWRSAVEVNPHLFNGPIVSPVTVALNNKHCTVVWHHSDFAHYLFSRHGSDERGRGDVGTLFVSVGIPTDDARIVVGQMAGHTSTPGTIQLPGGGVSVTSECLHLSHANLIETATHEVAEELGLALKPEDISVCGVISRKHPPDVGILFLSRPLPWQYVERSHQELVRREASRGVKSEFQQVFAIDPSTVHGHFDNRSMVDYLPQVLTALARIRQVKE